MCQIIGLEPIFIKGFGLSLVSSDNLVPYSPANITNFSTTNNHSIKFSRLSLFIYLLSWKKIIKILQ